MSDTVAASILTQSLGAVGPSFIVGPGVPASSPESTSGSVPGAMHVSGGAYSVDLVSGFGSPLLVDFVTFSAAGGDVPSPTVGGYGVGSVPDDPGPAVVGAIYAPD